MVTKPFYIDGALCQVGETITLEEPDALGLVSRCRAQLLPEIQQ